MPSNAISYIYSHPRQARRLKRASVNLVQARRPPLNTDRPALRFDNFHPAIDMISRYLHHAWSLLLRFDRPLPHHSLELRMVIRKQKIVALAAGFVAKAIARPMHTCRLTYNLSMVQDPRGILPAQALSTSQRERQCSCIRHKKDCSHASTVPPRLWTWKYHNPTNYQYTDTKIKTLPSALARPQKYVLQQLDHPHRLLPSRCKPGTHPGHNVGLWFRLLEI